MSSLDGVTIYIYKDSFRKAEPVYGELHILESSTTTLHYAGHQSKMRDIQFWILGSGIDEITDAFEDGDTVTFVDWQAASYNVKIKDITVTDNLWDIKRPGYGYTVLRCSAKLQEV